ncbi:alpha/beta fold hydrolase [Bacillus tuaregi]|uniref:alpha/beta fold hydrolase n=1 Tax=Bacillus tuaregi TaxID=1816695 RepID=UPI0008F858E9|nr:alpha/beta fold hydrolase [Bacillus tuaregi]
MKKHTVMAKWLLASTLGIAAVGVGGTLPAPAVYAEQSMKQADFEKAAKDFISLAEQQDWDTLYPLLSEQLQEFLPKEQLPQLWAGLNAYGKINNVVLQENQHNGLHQKVKLLVTAANGPLVFVFNYDENGKVVDFHPEQASDPSQIINPDYNHPENYIEKQITIGDAPFTLPGVLTLPKGDGPFPVVVLVHGSGPNDMDETAYGFKPFRDMAVGLANHGVAVLRYDKRTNTHSIKSSMDPKFSIMEETVEDANLAVEALKSIPKVDSKNIFVLGHSQGGYALPLILENDKSKDIKGGIGVAGPTGKFHELLLWQMEQSLLRAEEMNAPQEQLDAAKAQVDWLKSQITYLNDPQYSRDNLPPEFQLTPAYWWFDLNDYDPAELIKEQNVPLLFLQGGKDIQVPAEHLENWKAALDGRKNAQYQLYPDMMHFLANYPAEPDGMTEYMTPGNVAEEMINDIAEWVKTGTITEETDVDLTVYKDYEPGLFWSEPFAWAIGEGIIKGYEVEKVLKPYQPMTESEYLRVFLRYKLGEDLKDESLANIYSLAKSYGLPVKEKGNAALSRGEAAVLLVSTFTESTVSEEEAVQWLYDHNLVDGYLDSNGQAPKNYTSFKPNEPMKRSHIVTMLYRMDQANQ